MSNEFSDPNDAILTTDPQKKKFYEEINQHHSYYEKEDDWGVGDAPLTIDTREWKQRQEAEDAEIERRGAWDAENYIQEVPLDYREGQEYNRPHFGEQHYDHIQNEPVQNEVKYTDYYPSLREQLRKERKPQKLERDVYIQGPPKTAETKDLIPRHWKFNQGQTYYQEQIDQTPKNLKFSQGPTYYQEYVPQRNYQTYSTQTEEPMRYNKSTQRSIVPTITENASSQTYRPQFERQTFYQTIQPARTERFPRTNYRYTNKKWAKTKSGKWIKYE